MTSDFCGVRNMSNFCQINQFKVLVFYFDSFSNHYLKRVSSQQPKINGRGQIGSTMADSP